MKRAPLPPRTLVDPEMAAALEKRLRDARVALEFEAYQRAAARRSKGFERR